MSLEKYNIHKYHSFIISYGRMILVRIKRFLTYGLIPDKIAIRRKFKNNLGYVPNLDNPKTFQEQLQWLKLNDRKKWYTICADKFRVRKYITDILGTDEYLIPLVFHSEKVSDIKPENFPDTPFVLKCNHDNNSWVPVFNKETIDWRKLRSFYRVRMWNNLYWSNREWPYKNIKPCIIAETFLGKGQDILQEFKYYCFNGEVKFIQMSELDQKKLNKSFRYLRPDYTPLPENYQIAPPLKIIETFTLPKDLELMDKIVNTIAKEFEYFIRIDLFNVEDKCYVGELTFFDGAGYDKIVPNAWAETVSSYLTLPISK